MATEIEPLIMPFNPLWVTTSKREYREAVRRMGEEPGDTKGKHYYRVLGDKGIRTIYGMTGAESIPVLEAAAAKLSDEVSDDYWEATEGNAKRPLLQLAAMARMRPDGVWDGD